MPFNQDVHEQLIALAYQYARFEEDYEDIGNAESGPKLIGGPAFDQYESSTDIIIIDNQGHFADFQPMEAESHHAKANEHDFQPGVEVITTIYCYGREPMEIEGTVDRVLPNGHFFLIGSPIEYWALVERLDEKIYSCIGFSSDSGLQARETHHVIVAKRHILKEVI